MGLSRLFSYNDNEIMTMMTMMIMNLMKMIMLVMTMMIMMIIIMLIRITNQMGRPCENFDSLLF